MREFISSALQIALLLLLFAGGLPADEANNGKTADDPIGVRLNVSTSAVQRHDHILVKIVISNQLLSQVSLSDEQRGKSLEYRLEMSNDRETWKIVPINGRLRGKCVLLDSVSLAAGESFAFFGSVFLDVKGNLVFEKPGKYEMRSVVTTAFGEFRSPAIRFEIKDRMVGEHDSIAKNRELLNMQLAVVAPTKGFVEEIDALYDKMEQCEIKDTLRQSKLITEYLRASTLDEKGVSFKDAVRQLTANQPPVRRDLVCLSLARGLERQRKWDEATAVISMLAENSEHKSAVSGDILDALRRGMPLDAKSP